MSEEFQAHVFDSFSRERTSTQSGIKGTGLGMAITRNIVAMTANAFDEDEKKCMEAGMNAHLVKPLDIQKMKEAVCRYLNKQNDRQGD